MKRLLFLLGLPALMGAVWFAGQPHQANATANVTIDTDDVVGLRGTVISRMTGVGAAKIAESTSYTGGGRSDLTFRIPPARIEQALSELGSVGGVVAEQQVELENAAETANGVSIGLDGISGCLGELADQVTQRQAGPADVSRCRAKIDVVSKNLQASPAPVQDAVVQVHLRRGSTTNPILLLAVAILAVALAAMAYLTFRSSQIDRMIDLSEDSPSRSLDDLYTRRN